MNFVTRNKNLHFAYFVVSLLLIMSLASACALPKQSPSQIESIGQITTAATNAREGVLLVRKYVSDENSWEYTEARRLYGEAQAAFNGWIEQLKADIIFGAEPDTEKYDKTLAAANQKTIDFLKHVAQIEQVHASRGVGDSTNNESATASRDNVAGGLIIGITAAIVKEVVVGAGIEFWKENQKLKAQEQTRNIEYLDTLLWPSFEDIK
ncbi:MAG: hypothetical protein R3C14_51975 [Caldilineaceae bacterium]